MNINPDVFIIFTRSTKNLAIGSWVISESEKRDYSHCAILYRCPISNELMVFQASLGLVNCFNYNIFKQHNKIIKTYKIDVSSDSFIEFYKFKQKNLGKKYSKLQLVWISLSKLFQVKQIPVRFYNLIKNGDSEYVCSEIAAITCGMLDNNVAESLTQKQLDIITPSDLETILKERGLHGQDEIY